MTLQYYKDLPAIIAAVENGEEWEYNWKTDRSPKWISPVHASASDLLDMIEDGKYIVRLKPAPPAPRWWEKPEDVPINAEWFFIENKHWRRLMGVTETGVNVGGYLYNWDEVIAHLQWSPDRNRANLKPCQTEGER